MVSNSAPNMRVTPCGSPFAPIARADLEHGRRAVVRGLAEVERGMRVEDLQPAHEQHGQRDDVDPVHDAHRQRMPVVEVTAPVEPALPQPSSMRLLQAGRASGYRRAGARNASGIACAMVARAGVPYTAGRRARRTMRRMSDAAPYASLTPDRILDALDSVGVARRRPPARASTATRTASTSSYCEDAPPVVVKFYRPGRWTDAQILEEHAFVAELAEREIPAVAPLVLDGRTLHHVRRLALRRVSEARRPHARARRSGDARMARPLHRPHPRGRRACAVRAPPGARHRDVRRRAARVPARRTISCPPTCSRRTGRVSAMALDGVRHCFERAGDVRDAAPARRLPREQRAVDATTGRTSSTSTTRARARPCRTCGCCCPATAPR